MYRTYGEWKVRIGSPRELYWELKRFLEKEEFETNKSSEALILEPTPIEGHATFSKDVEGQRSLPVFMLWMFILGLILCFTIILIPIGIWLMSNSKYDVIQKAKIHLAELRDLPIIDSHSQSKIKNYIDDLVFALYFGIAIDDSRLTDRNYIHEVCSNIESYQLLPK